MRRLQLCDRQKLRGIPRRLRALSKWADKFAGYYYPRSEAEEKYCHWKIPVISSLVNPPHTTKEIQAQCMNLMIHSAQLIAQSLPQHYCDYYKVPCLFTLPWIFSSQVIIFYDPSYYLGFFGKTHELAPRQLSREFGLIVPQGFVERGFIFKDEVEEITEEW